MWEEWQICNVEMMPGVRGVEQVHGQHEIGRGDAPWLDVREVVVDEGEEEEELQYEAEESHGLREEYGLEDVLEVLVVLDVVEGRGRAIVGHVDTQRAEKNVAELSVFPRNVQNFRTQLENGKAEGRPPVGRGVEARPPVNRGAPVVRLAEGTGLPALGAECAKTDSHMM